MHSDPAAMSDSKDVVAMLTEMRKGMITHDSLKKTVSEAVNEAINTHIEPLARQQKEMEKKFDEVLLRLTKLEAGEASQQGKTQGARSSQGEPQVKRARSTEQPASRAPLWRHLQEHEPINPTSGRTIKLTGFSKHLSPEELADFVKPLLVGHEYERISSGRPRDDEVRVVFKTKDDRDDFRKEAMERDNPSFQHRADNTSDKLYWNLPETKEEKRKKYVVRKLRDWLPDALEMHNFESNQRSGRIFADQLPLLTITVDPEGEIIPRYREKTLTELKIDKAVIDGLIRRALAE